MLLLSYLCLLIGEFYPHWCWYITLLGLFVPFPFVLSTYLPFSLLFLLCSVGLTKDSAFFFFPFFNSSTFSFSSSKSFSSSSFWFLWWFENYQDFHFYIGNPKIMPYFSISCIANIYRWAYLYAKMLILINFHKVNTSVWL